MFLSGHIGPSARDLFELRKLKVLDERVEGASAPLRFHNGAIVYFIVPSEENFREQKGHSRRKKLAFFPKELIPVTFSSLYISISRESLWVKASNGGAGDSILQTH